MSTSEKMSTSTQPSSSSSFSSYILTAALAGAGSYVAFRASRALAAPTLPKTYSVLLPGDKEDDGGKIHVNSYDMGVEEACKQFLPAYAGTLTTWALFKATASKFAPNPFHGTLNPRRSGAGNHMAMFLQTLRRWVGASSAWG